LGDGGAAWARGSATIDRASFTANQSGGRGGALFISSTLTLSSSKLINNYAVTGGGLYQAAGAGRIVNTLFARNTASSNTGVALYLAPTGTLKIYFTTIGAPNLANGDAVRIASGNVEIQNTIVASHTTGLYRLGGTVFQDYNLLSGNTNPPFGVISGGTHNASGDPKFLNPGVDNYHLGLTSAAINAGTDVGVFTDYDGQPRPQGGGFDIGFDEVFVARIYLPLILR
jgi:predicted outer membrane repeat protein